jgi:hypothetical protein
VLKAGGMGATFAFAAAVAFCASPVTAIAAVAAEPPLPAPALLLTGSVRDQSGAAPSARVLVRDAHGRVVGSAETGRDGTFAALLDAAPAEVEVDCAHCARLRVAATGGPLALVVTRFAALAGAPPQSDDFAALPYRDPAQALALTPYVVALQTGGGLVAALSDRGLGGGDGLVIDEGVPAYDPASADPGLFAFPGRSLGTVSNEPASRAFEYGSYAGGGTFALDPFGAEGTGTAFDTGWGFALAQRLQTGPVQALFAGSSDPDGVLRERIDLSAVAALGTGTLRGTASLASQSVDDLSVADARSRALASLFYSVVSQRAVTDLAIDALDSRAAYELPYSYGQQAATSASALDARIRIERPAWLSFAYGGFVRRANAGYGDAPGTQPGAAYDTGAAYVEAAHDGPLGFAAGLGVQHSDARSGATGMRSGETVVLPSLVANAGLGPDLSLHAGVSSALRAPLPYELPQYASAAYVLERSSVEETGLAFDDRRRFQAGATVFAERSTGLTEAHLHGVGFSLAWQIAPRLSLRAWTLHDALNADAQALTDQPGDLGTSLARAVAWLSYESPGGLRFDALARGARDASGRESDLDADVVVPVRAGVALTAGSERERGRRRSYVGLRLR